MSCSHSVGFSSQTNFQEVGILAAASIPFASWTMQGGIILGLGEDGSNASFGTFFEGAITVGRPSDATDAAVLANVQAAKYGQ